MSSLQSAALWVRWTDLPRLQRLIQVYLSAVELPAFFLLGQLWDRLLGEDKLELPSELLTIISDTSVLA